MTFELMEQDLLVIDQIPTVKTAIFGVAMTVNNDEQENKYISATQELTIGWAVEPILATEEFEPKEYSGGFSFQGIKEIALAVGLCWMAL